MKQILQINSSVFGSQGESTQLANQLVSHLAEQYGSHVTVRDVSSSPIPHQDAGFLQALSTPENTRDTEQQSKVTFADQLIEELQASDLLVIGLPMYNFGVPSTLKAWFDHIARAGVTFRYTENGPEGLLRDKQAIVVTTRGGIHKNTDLDTETPFVKSFLAFIGITNVSFIYAEGLNMGEKIKNRALSEAEVQLKQLSLN
ncbi:FMN-dependent NADH-azoreductase [Spartinivicinus poritis]|uniref:FMN dependent NADH:quinone oxidoreductase n=1 Tax=Spartinivicinus poritis TaxID=2994640 RepID=A0ABT5U5S4_9GAMM|nr:NAD(P)H-dependent oxidoreductase [Spartinivicinus sp. A2-2]MDE1461704.1 NAD(P)H-dependent oxidoreductase [Spartinivicinus sp. A2-2]